MRILSLLFLIVLTSPLYGQTDSTRIQGEILTGEVIIEKDKEIILPIADKIFLRGAVRSPDSRPLNLTFDVQDPDFKWPAYKSDVPFQKAEQNYPSADYQNYLKLGYGNFNSPLVESGLFRKFGRWDSQVKLNYERFKSGPVNGENSGSADFAADLSTSYRKKGLKITPSMTFEQRQFSFYGSADRMNTGFPAITEDGKVNYFLTSVDAVWEDGDTKYRLTPTFSSLRQTSNLLENDNEETSIGINASLQHKIDDKVTAALHIEGMTADYDGGIAYDRSLINLRPNVLLTKESFTLNAGIVLSSGKVDQSSKTAVYPQAHIRYNLSDRWSFFGNLEGGIMWNSLNDLMRQNSFMDDSLTIVNTENKFSIGGGLEGNPLENVLLKASLTHYTLDGAPFFVSSSSDSSKFTLTYDTESINLLQLNSSISFMPTATSTYGFSLQLNGYSLSDLDRPWHVPAIVFKAYTSHNIKEKLIFSAFITSMGGIRGPADVDFGFVKLPGFTDIGMGAKYLLSSRASIFIDVNNLLNNEYERYLGYPIRGLAFKIGGQYRF